MSENESFNYIWGFFAIPLGYLYTLAVGHRGKISKHETQIAQLEKDMKKIDSLCEDVAYIKGKIDEHLRKSD